MVVYFKSAALAACGFLAVLSVPWSARADLFDYVKRPEPSFKWELKGKNETDQGTVYDLQLTSQTWQGIPWQHQLQVYQPKGTTPTRTMLLWNTGGGANAANTLFGMEIAKRVKAPVAFLFHVPNQPLLDGKKEDALIAETYVRYLQSKDENWPLLFPMVKSVVKAMDALQAFSKEQWKQPVEKFIVAGASKRGWTSWLTAASGDSRVKAIAPLVIDTLGMDKQMPRQLEHFGKYSEQIKDYTERGLVPMPDTPEARKLGQMVDPLAYADGLRLPKMIINGNNDPYWTVDALNVYWDALKGDKWVSYTPNAGHNLQQKDKAGLDALSHAVNTLAAFTRHQISDNPMPVLDWKHEDAAGKLRLTVTAKPTPKAARLWLAQSPTKDFRKATWKDQPMEMRGSQVVGEVMPPADGFSAFYGELEYDLEGLPYYLSTQIRVAGGK